MGQRPVLERSRDVLGTVLQTSQIREPDKTNVNRTLKGLGKTVGCTSQPNND